MSKLSSKVLLTNTTTVKMSCSSVSIVSITVSIEDTAYLLLKWPKLVPKTWWEKFEAVNLVLNESKGLDSLKQYNRLKKNTSLAKQYEPRGGSHFIENSSVKCGLPLLLLKQDYLQDYFSTPHIQIPKYAWDHMLFTTNDQRSLPRSHSPQKQPKPFQRSLKHMKVPTFPHCKPYTWPVLVLRSLAWQPSLVGKLTHTSLTRPKIWNGLLYWATVYASSPSFGSNSVT